MVDVQNLTVQIPHETIQYWGWFLALGTGLMLLGTAAVVRSITATVASMFLFGWLLVMASGIQIAQAVIIGHWADPVVLAKSVLARCDGDHEQTSIGLTRTQKCVSSHSSC